MALYLQPGDGIATMHWYHIPTASENTVTCGYRDSTGTYDAGAAASAIRGYWQGAGAPANAANMVTEWRMDGVSTYELDSVGLPTVGASLVTTTGTIAVGTGVTPIFTPLVVSKLTAYAGRSWRGRMYAPPARFLETSVDAVGTILSGQLTIERANFTTLHVAWASGQYKPYLFHDDSASIVHKNPVPVTSFYVRPVLGIQRRRRARGA